ncbi:MAG: hypothetical protein JWO25_3011 [Alphaproteobacteria bacterium]|nr:hypothetical protein [Alphaproteobacteria bacterium]
MVQDHLAPTLHAAIAEEIRGMRMLIEQLAEQLTGDERFALHHFEQLQTFDLIVQRADESADLLDRMASGSRVVEAVDAVRLTAVQDRLRAALLAA